MNEPILVTRKEFAEKLGVSVRTVDRMVKDGRIPEPAIERPNKRYWTANQVAKVRQSRTKRDNR